MKNRISKNFHVPLNSLSSVKTANSSLARGHMGGGGDPGPNTHTAATIRKEVLNPPQPPPPPKRGTEVQWGMGVKIQKIIGGSFLVLK